MGEDMRYEKLDYQLIDYPGEYDINGMIIQCFLGADQKLNYVLSTGTKRIGLIQSLDVLDLSDVGVVGHWLYTDERIANKIDQMELEGEKQKLEAEEVSE